MRTIYKIDLEEDVLTSKYLDLDSKIYLKDGSVYESSINGYTYDNEPFCNYIEINSIEIPFDDILKIEIID